MNTLKYVLLFAALQAAALALAIVGLPICAVLAALSPWSIVSQPGYKPNLIVAGWPSWAWIWSNDEDGVRPTGYTTRWGIFKWTALRNSVNNFRFVPGVSKPGWPLWYRTFTLSIPWRISGEWMLLTKQFYAKAGWANVTGWPMLSAGGGRGY